MTPEDLVDIEAIKQLKARYFRLMDTKRWDEWADVFTPDAVMGTGRRRVEGREAIVDFVANLLLDYTTVHHGHMPEIEITGPETATAIWSMYDRVEFPDPKGIEGYGHYVEDYERGADGAWRIKRLDLTRLKIVPIPPAG
ncbi:MAG TPA: nuclear transport factor 2 family protein [Acidimicrobiales bacterium]|nr:nuclear transport factor 2 family protein [Acidimicrobiales bacterium]